MNNMKNVQMGNDRPLTRTADRPCEFNWDKKRKQTAHTENRKIRHGCLEEKKVNSA